MDNHIILLRLNQFWEKYLTSGQYTREQMYEGDPSWLDIRLKWLDKYLIANLKTQQDKDFWLFFLSDPGTPLFYKEKIKEYESLGFVKVIESNDPNGEKIDKLILDTYKSIRNNNNNEIICSRLDTDDMVGPHWNSVIKQLLEKQNRISLETVLLYNFLNKETKILKFSKGSFVSTKSTLDKFDNPRGFPHGNSNALSVDTDYPLVCMGIHDNNITNHNWWSAGNSYSLNEEEFNQMFITSK
jgi:hypothetical protein